MTTAQSLLLVLALATLSLSPASAFAPRNTPATAFTRPLIATAPVRRTVVFANDNNVPTTERTEATTTTSSSSSSSSSSNSSSVNESNAMQAAVEEKKENNNLMRKIKDAGVAGAISLGIWEGLFWCFSIPVALIGYQQLTGHWPNLSDKEDLAKLGAEAFAFVNFARFAVPLRVGLALSTTPWVQENIVNTFGNKKEEELERPEIEMTEQESNSLKN